MEPEWRVDVRGKEEGIVDEEGWRYAFDFIAMKPTPGPGSGVGVGWVVCGDGWWGGGGCVRGWVV